MADFTHFNDQGRAKMVDVCVGGEKAHFSASGRCGRPGVGE